MNIENENLKRPSRRQIREYFMEYLDDRQPHTMAEINTYVREKLSEAGYSVPGQYGDFINMAISPLLHRSEGPYKRVRHGIYQKTDPLPRHASRDLAHEFLDRCFELDECAQRLFSKDMPDQNIGKEGRQNYSIVKERIPQLLDEVLTYASIVTAIVEDMELETPRQVPPKVLQKKREDHER